MYLLTDCGKKSSYHQSPIRRLEKLKAISMDEGMGQKHRTLHESDRWPTLVYIVSKVTASQSEITKLTTESASSVAVQASWGLLGVSGGGSHTNSTAKSMSFMANLDIEVAMDYMLVEIYRPWLHDELLVDQDLDVSSE